MKGMNIAITPAIQKICHLEDTQSSLQPEANPKFTTPDGARGTSLSCQIPSLVDENLSESWLADRGDRRAVAWFALAALLTPASLHCLAAVPL